MTTKIDSVEGLQRVMWGFAASRVITVAARAGLFDACTQGPVTGAFLAEQLELDPLATNKMLRALSAIGLLEAGPEGYGIAPPFQPYFSGDANDFSPFLAHSHHLDDRWGENLEPWLKGEEWTTQRRSADGVRAFGCAMQAMGSQIAGRVAEAIDLDGTQSLLDVGGGFGHYSKAFLAKYPNLVATVLDVPEVATHGQELASTGPFSTRLSFVGGDYLSTECGNEFDAVLLANVVHQESPERAPQLVKKAANSLKPGGQLLIVDFAIDDDKSNHVLGCLFAINMRSFGDTYSYPELAAMMKEAGLSEMSRTDIG